MDKQLQLIAHLYDEANGDCEPLRELLKDPELASEYRALSEARFAVDHGPRVRPDPSVVNAIVRKASVATSGSLARADRAPLRRLGRRHRLVAAGLALAAVVALTVMVRPWDMLPDTRSMPTVAENPFDFAVPAESLLRALPPSAAPTATAVRSSIPEWDSGDDLRRLSRRIESLQAAGVTAWDEPAVPLEMLPSGSQSGLLPAGARRDH